MAVLPSISKPYSTRGNVPFQANGSQLLLAQSLWFSLKEHMKNTLAGGTLAGTRHANSVWTMRYSCDGTTAGTAGDGVDRWLAHTNLIWANSGTAHSWCVLRNATLGIEVCIDCVTVSTTTLSLTATEVAQPFTGGSTTVRPDSVGYTFCCGNTSTTPASCQFTAMSDVSTGNQNWTHYTTADDGCFFFSSSRTGLTLFPTFVALQKTTGNHVTDTRNIFWIGHSVATTRGAPAATAVLDAATGCVGRCQNGTQFSTGGLRRVTFGAASLSGVGVDEVSGDYLAFPLDVTSVSPQFVKRGILPDFFFTSGGAPGASVPSAAAQNWVIMGDFIVPMYSVNPNY